MRLTPIVGFGVTIVALISLAAHPTCRTSHLPHISLAAHPASAQTISNAGWTFSGAGISGNGSAFTAGNPNAPAGNQVAFLQQSGFFSQAISGFKGGTYTFQFDAAQCVSGINPSGIAGGGGINNGYSSDLQNFQVLVDGNALYGASGLTPAVTIGGVVGGYQLYTTGPVALSAGTHTLTFQGLDTAYQTAGRTGSGFPPVSDNTAFIDAVGINASPVPEGSTAVSLGLLLCLGLGGRVVCACRRKMRAAE